jgi:pimeloyl-ACP methyl ester carboxylesterase
VRDAAAQAALRRWGLVQRGGSALHNAAQMLSPPAAEVARTLRRSDGASLAYHVVPAAGEAAPLLLLHGLASNHTRWSEFVEHSALRGQRALIRPDLRGYGESSTGGRITLEVWADDLAALLDHEGHARAVVVGHSLGAQVALGFAQRHPARVAALGLIDPVFRDALKGRARWVARLAPLLRGLAGLVRGLNALGLRRRRLPWQDLRALDREARAALATPAGVAAFVRRYGSRRDNLRHVRSSAYLQSVAEMLRPPPDPAALAMPVLALLSTGATYADAQVTRAWLQALPRLTLQTVACQHWPLTERPDEVRAAIEHWCDALDGPPPH